MSQLFAPTPSDLEKLSLDQSRMADLVDVPQAGSGYQPEAGDLLFTLDVQYVGEAAFVAADVMRWPNEPVTTIVHKLSVTFPYIPQYFAFREGPLLKQMIALVEDEIGQRADLLLIDGHGRAHPRKFGIACYVGLELGIPTIGCAKEPLLSFDRSEIETARGSILPLFRTEDVARREPLGMVLVTQDGVRPLFVSSGHLVSNETAVDTILHLASRYRQPEPIRRADQAARRASKSTPHL